MKQFKAHLHHLLRILFFALCSITLPSMCLANEPVIVAAADLKFALDEVAKSFKQETAKSVNIIYGSSGTFATQIRNGAPFQMYLSADEDFVFKLHSEGLTRDQGHLYAIGRIVLMAPKGSNLSVDSDLTGLAAKLKSGKITRFAIANPELVCTFFIHTTGRPDSPVIAPNCAVCRAVVGLQKILR